MSAPQRLAALEATFLALSSPEVPFVPGCVIELDRPLGLAPLQTKISELLAQIPRYCQRIARAPVLGSLAWVDDEELAIDRHVGALRIPAPGGQRELEEMVATVLMLGVPADHPPWRLWTVEGLADGRGALIAIVHHALVDGVAGIGLLERLLRLTPEVPAVRPVRLEEPPPTPLRQRIRERIAAELRGRAEGWRRLTSQLDVRHHGSALVELLGLALRPSSDLGFGTRISGERSFAVFTTGLDATKAIKRAFDVKVNDVLVACVAGALRRFVARRGLDPRTLTDARAMVPVSRHTRGEHATFGNEVTLMLAQLALDEADPVARLRRIASTTATLKHHDMAGAGDIIVALSDVTWSGVLTNIFRIALRRRAFTIGITNVPGPPVPLYLLDRRVTRIIPIMNLWPHVPIAIAIGSYAGWVTISVDADRALMPDAPAFVDDLAVAFDELRTAATTAGGRPAPAPPA